MLFSDKRKLALAGWLQQNYPKEYNSVIKLHSFLFIYEAACKAWIYPYDLQGFKAYPCGPVFQSVWDDSTKSSQEFSRAALSAISERPAPMYCHCPVPVPRLARVVAEYCSGQTERELIEFLQSYDIWKAHADEVSNSRGNPDLNLDDFSPADRSRTFALTKDFPNSEDDEEEEDEEDEEREEWPENNGITNGIQMYYT